MVLLRHSVRSLESIRAGWGCMPYCVSAVTLPTTPNDLHDALPAEQCLCIDIYYHHLTADTWLSDSFLETNQYHSKNRFVADRNINELRLSNPTLIGHYRICSTLSRSTAKTSAKHLITSPPCGEAKWLAVFQHIYPRPEISYCIILLLDIILNVYWNITG